MAMACLNGQKLMSIQINPSDGTTEFSFDLGAKLLTRCLEKDDSDIWTLYKPNGFVLGVRGDGTFTYGRGTTPKGEAIPRQIGMINAAVLDKARERADRVH